MTYNKSAAPYLILLFIIVVGAPLLNYGIEKEQSIKIEIKTKTTAEAIMPVALK